MSRPTNQSVIAKNSAWNALDRAINLASTIITSVAVARMLGPDKLGYYIYLLWLTGITGSLGSLGIPAATRKFAAEYRGRGEIGMAARIVLSNFRLQLMLASFVVAAAIAVVATGVGPEHRTYALIAAVSLFPLFLMQIATAANNAAEDYGANVKASLISTVVGFAGVIISLAAGWDLVGLAASLLIARITDFWIRHVLFWRKFRSDVRASGALPDLPPELRVRMRKFCQRSLGVLLIAAVVWDRSELFFLKMFADTRDIAFYSLGFNISQQLVMIPQVFSTAAGATLMVVYGRDPRGAGRIAANTLRYLVVMALPMMIGVAALGSPLVRVLYGDTYSPAIPVLILCALFMIPKAVLMPAQQLLIAGERQNTILKWGFACAAINILLDVLLIPGGRATGAAVANGLTQTIAALGIWYAAVRSFEVPIPGRMLFRVTVSATIMGVVVALIARSIPAVPALLIAPPVGFGLYLALLSITGALEPVDRERLRSILSQASLFLRRTSPKSPEEPNNCSL